MIVLNYRKYRRAMEAYRRNWGLKAEHGFTVETGRPLGRPARKLLVRIQENLNARDLLPAKYIDGTLNSRTQRLLIPPLTPADKAVAYAVSQLGVHEHPWGSNRGHDVERYQRSTGAYGLAWCASFVWYCWQQAGYRGPTSAGAWRSTDELGTRVSLAHARAGDLVSLNIGAGHVGILLKKNQHDVTLVAGNTNNTVREREYSNASIHSICRPHVG